MSCATRFLVLLAAPLPPRFPSFLRLSRLHRLHLRQRRLHSLSSLALHRYHTLGSSPHHSPPLRIEASSSAQFHAQSDAVDEDHLVHPVDSNSWPEWTNLVGILSSSGYFVERNGFGAPVAQGIGGDDEFVAGVDLQEEFIRAARACLAFARDRPQLLRTLAKRDIDVLVQNGSPFLFNNADDSIQKMRSFVNGTEGTIIDGDKAQTVDLMRFILSYASNPAMLEKSFSSFSNLYVVASVRNLLREMANLSYAAPQSNSARSVESLLAGEYGQTPRPLGQNIEMKRGDWICPRCNFMNFARNMKCLECEVVRPKRQLTGAEWECPQCDFVNYGRNVVCLRCECKRPGETSPRVPSGFGWVPGSSSNDADNSDIDRRLAVNEEKAQRWFNKVSQLDSTSDIKNAIADEDFPEIMPLRKGVNRFVVSTKKTPLERRLANDQPRSGLTANGTPDFDDDRSWDVNKMPNSPVNQRLGGISGCKSVDSGSSGSPSFSNSSPPQLGHRGGNNSGYVPFVPLPADMFAKKPVSSKTEVETIVTGGSPTDKEQGYAVSGSNISGESETALQPAEQPVIQTDSQERDRGEEKSDGWFKRVTELPDSRDLPSASSDGDFRERMPMRKGDNRFVVGRAKDRSLTSPLYKRRAALEQSSSANFVPFVPFPPGYFAKKENERSSGENPNDNAAFEAKSTLAAPEKLQGGAVESRSNVSNSCVPPTETHQFNTGNCNAKPPAKKATQNNSMVNFGLPDAGMPKDSGNQQMGIGSSVGPGSYHGSRSTSKASNLVGSSRQPSEIFNVREQWSGKSLEGSAVKEPDPLDMSEEAKAERWFRRVAQIKDISELSQIPDEDFPSIMPMRKGVNRFVVSKRKTPLERRLTSPQYRRNLPVVNSDTTKGEDENK